MRNTIGENFSQNEHKETGVQLSDSQKEFLNRALSMLNDNPEVGASVKNDFDANLNDALKNPETFQQLLEKIDTDMHAKINAIAVQVQAGEIYAEDGKNAAKNIIISATRTKLDAVQREQEISEKI